MTAQTPLIWPQDLEPHVLAWYVRIAKNGGTIQSHLRHDLDWRDPRRVKDPDRPGREKAIRFNEDEMRWTQALVDAGLATYSPSKIIEAVWINQIWAHASVARDGSDYDYYATVHLLDERSGVKDRDGVIIAFLHGAQLDRSDDEGPYSEWRLAVKHVKATDFEHDSVHLANFKLQQVMIEDLDHAGTLTVVAILGKAEMYGRGNDPLENETDDPEIGSSWCDGWVDQPDGQHEPHPFAPYTVKDDEHKARLAQFRGRLVRIELTARHLVDENGKLLRRKPDNDEDGED